MTKLARFILVPLALLLALMGVASAQVVQQTAQRLDAAAFAVVSTNYNTVNTQGVATISPPAGQYVYITRIELEAVQDGTSTACVLCAFTSTGLGTGATASPQWGFSIAATADAVLMRDVTFTTPLRSAIAGQNVTITSPAATLHLGFGIKVYGYFSP